MIYYIASFNDNSRPFADSVLQEAASYSRCTSRVSVHWISTNTSIPITGEVLHMQTRRCLDCSWGLRPRPDGNADMTEINEDLALVLRLHYLETIPRTRVEVVQDLRGWW